MAPSLTHRFIHRLRGGGLKWLVAATCHRLVPQHLAMKRQVLEATRRAIGLEIGGPSREFAARRLLPVYRQADRIDNVNFSAQTAWESSLCDGGPFHFDPPRASGTQWLREATLLSGIADATYDFVLSSHCLEHTANPLRALSEWRRVTRPGGHLVLLLPDPLRSFDHRRPISTIEHLREDFARNTCEDDVSHVQEVLALHDISRDPGAGSPAAFRARVEQNRENRCLHHHVFDLALMMAALNETGWLVLATETARPVHLVSLAKNPAVS